MKQSSRTGRISNGISSYVTSWCHSTTCWVTVFMALKIMAVYYVEIGLLTQTSQSYYPPGLVIYRIWSRIRIVQVQHLFTPLLAPFQSGSQGPGCLDLFIGWDQEFPPKIFGFCAALDYTKCFDSLALRLWAGFGLWTLMRPPKPAQMPKDNIYSARPKVRMSIIRFTLRDKDHFCRWPKWWFCIYFIAIPAIRDENKRLGWWSSMIQISCDIINLLNDCLKSPIITPWVWMWVAF